MACISGSNIVKDGLVFYFDLENGVKSWKGKPASNLIETNLLNYTKDNGCTVISTGEYYQGNPVYRVTFNYGTLPRIRTNFSYTNATTFTGSIYYRVVSQGSRIPSLFFREINFGTTYVSAPLNSTEWTRATISHTFSGSGTAMFLLYQSSSNSTSDTVIDFAMPQTEVGEFATKYVNGFRLDTASIIDVSGNNRTITASNLTYRQDDTPTFDGTDDYLSIPFNEGINNLGNGSFTFESIVKFTESGGQYGIFSKNTSFANGWAVYLRQGPQFNILGYLPDGTPQTPFCGTPSGGITTNTWYHLIYTYDQIKIIGYINGTEVAAVNYSGDFRTNTTADSTIGYSAGISQPNYFPGEIDQIKLYNRALTSAEIKQNFESTRSRYGI